jgi:hypothetical protein
MPRKSKRLATSLLIPAAPADAVFHRADILYALEWAAAAPGIGGWNVQLDDDQQTRKVSVVPPGSEVPTFFIARAGSEVQLTWLRGTGDRATIVEVARFASLREAVRSLCALSDGQIESVNDAMEALYPRTLRTA